MNWPGRIVIIAIIAFALSVPNMPISSGDPIRNGGYLNQATRTPGMNPVPIYDEVVKVPPGGETTIKFGPDMEPTEGGYVGLKEWDHGKLGEAASLLPDWLHEPFKENMIRAASREISLGQGMIPTFGDLDNDGDEDLLIGYAGDLYYYNNTGTQGYPVYTKSHHILLDYYGGGFSWISPTLCDVNLDGYTDLLIGTDSGRINIALNNWRGEKGFWLRFSTSGGTGIGFTSLSFLSSEQIQTNDSHLAYELTISYGAEDGELYTFTVDVHEIEYDPYGPSRFRNIRENEVEISGIPRSLNVSSPLAWQPDIDQTRNYPDIVMGSGEGTMMYYVMTSVEGNTVNYRPDPTYFQGITNPGPIKPAFTDLDGDREPDLVVGSGLSFLPAYQNHQGPWNPYWAPDPHVPAFQVENYESAFGMNIMEYNESLIEEILDLIISPPDTRYRDEIGFCCAYMPPSQLQGELVDDLLRENAYHIYSRDGDLGYVSLEEYSGSDYYTTAEYRVRNGDKIEYMEIPRDIYYWGIVHPRVTEERVAYVSPDSGEATHPENGGRFWREYVFDHADEEYPEGPEYPEDWTGPVSYYPRDDSPPLLSDVLQDVDVLWDLMPYSYPKGYDNNGETNGHPWDLRDHAIEKVSHWVEKTLVINQQESPDDERPTQPVRIAHHHNGNCGELQDLTIAAARSALIPARGILLMGEDHVWSEFYIGGWHQWDNYWSDAGGVLADQLNYWWGWGSRGGSGLMAYMGDGQGYDVGKTYRSPDITGELVVNVVDASGDPVDGARVLVFSHWVMEQINVDLGPYQGPLPATVPLPSIWGYTDQTGTCSLDVWRQSVNFRVVSDIGTYVSEKFTMPDTGPVFRTVQLENEMPELTTYYQGGSLPDFGKKYVVYAEMIGTEQSQTDFISGVEYSEKMDTGSMIITLFVDDNGALPRFIDVLRPSDGDTPYLTAFSSGDLNATISLRSLSSIKTTNLVWVKIFEVEETEGMTEPSLIPFNPLGRDGSGFENTEIGPLAGMVLDPTGTIFDGIRNISIGGLIDDPSIIMTRSSRTPAWAIPWSAQGLSGRPGSLNPISLNIETDEGQNTSFSMSILIRDTNYPIWTSLDREVSYSWGGTARIGLTFPEDTDNIDLFGWIGFDPIGGKTISGEWDPTAGEWSIDTADLQPGNNRFRMVMIDEQDNLQTLSFGMRIDPVPPNLTLMSPNNGSQIENNMIEVIGTLFDDVSLSSFTASIPGSNWDLLDSIDDDNFFRAELVLDPDPGPVIINFTAVDNVGLVSSYDLHLEILERPDITNPSISFKTPGNGDEIEKGETITIRGTAEDDRGITSIILEVPGSSKELISGFDDPSWLVDLDTSGWPTGNIRLTARAADAAGNIGTDSVEVEVYEEVVPFRDRRNPEVLIISPEPNAKIDVDDEVVIMGSVSDDGDVIKLFISLDNGETMMDITDALESDWSFSYSLDVSGIVEDLSLSADKMVDILNDYSIFFMTVDGADKVTYLTLPLTITDSSNPIIVSMNIPPIEDDDQSIVVNSVIRDTTMLESVRFSLIDPRGRLIEEEDVSGIHIHGGNGEYFVNWSFERPRNGGEYTIEIYATDPWGNTDVDRLDLSIPKETIVQDDEDPSVIIPIFIIIGTLILLFIVIYAVARISRKITDRRLKEPKP